MSLATEGVKARGCCVTGVYVKEITMLDALQMPPTRCKRSKTLEELAAKGLMYMYADQDPRWLLCVPRTSGPASAAPRRRGRGGFGSIA